MSTVPWTISLPEDLSRTLRRRVPARGRSRFISEAVRDALEKRQRGDLTKTFLEAARLERLAETKDEAAEWDRAAADGLSDEPVFVLKKTARRTRA